MAKDTVGHNSVRRRPWSRDPDRAQTGGIGLPGDCRRRPAPGHISARDAPQQEQLVEIDQGAVPAAVRLPRPGNGRPVTAFR